MKNLVVIDDEVLEVIKYNRRYMPNTIELEDGTGWYIFESVEEAGEAARRYWEDMAHDDPREFACLVGEKTLIQWGLGNWAGPGSTQVKSLEEWLDLWLDTPEEHFASYDSEEKTCRMNKSFKRELGFDEDQKEFVCYRYS